MFQVEPKYRNHDLGYKKRYRNVIPVGQWADDVSVNLSDRPAQISKSFYCGVRILLYALTRGSCFDHWNLLTRRNTEVIQFSRGDKMIVRLPCWSPIQIKLENHSDKGKERKKTIGTKRSFRQKSNTLWILFESLGLCTDDQSTTTLTSRVFLGEFCLVIQSINMLYPIHAQ